jgi:hypothetical protein
LCDAVPILAKQYTLVRYFAPVTKRPRRGHSRKAANMDVGEQPFAGRPEQDSAVDLEKRGQPFASERRAVSSGRVALSLVLGPAIAEH